MVTEEAKRRAKILSFWEEFGEEAVKKAFNVSRRTLFRWQGKLNVGQGKLEALNSTSKAPKKRRSRIIPEEVANIIIRNRKIYWKFGKKKLQKMLEIEGFIYSESTVGRFISDLKKKGLLPDPIKLSLNGKTGKLHQRKRVKIKKKRRPKNYEDCFEIDTIVRFVLGLRRYIVTAINTKTKFAFALTYNSHTSETASHFMKTLKNLYGKPIKTIQTDNGSEFAKNFHNFCLKENITHYFTYPRSPKMNAHVERFNRTLQEEFIFQNNYKMLNLKEFNDDLMNYLHWYNTERPHHSLNLFSPMQYIVNTLKEECHMW